MDLLEKSKRELSQQLLSCEQTIEELERQKAASEEKAASTEAARTALADQVKVLEEKLRVDEERGKLLHE